MSTSERTADRSAAASAARLAPSEAPAMPTLPGRTSGRADRYDTLARTSILHAPRIFESPGSDAPGRSIASTRMFASARRWPTASQSSLGRPSIGTSTTAGAGRCEGSKTIALIVRPSSARNETPRPAANAGEAIRQTRKVLDSQDIKKFADALREADKQRVADERVADRHFIEMRQAAEQHEVVEIEVVTRVHAEAERMRELRGAGVDGERLTRVRLAVLERSRERFRVQLDAVAAHLRRPPNRRLLRIDEQADANVRVS